ncbi:MAG: metallophosphoesterase family protein [Pseudomonadales bacterium]
MTTKRNFAHLANRRLLIVFSVFAALNCNASGVAKTDKSYLNEPENFQFAIVGDRTGEHRKGVFASAVEQLNLLRPEFVVSVGDLIEGYSEDKQVLEQEWHEFDRHVKALDMPFYYVVGNHDMGNEVMLEMWRQRLGPTYFHFVYKKVLFIALNTEDPPMPMDPKLKAEVGELIALSKTDPPAAQKKYE